MTGYSYEPARAHDWLAVATAGRLLVAGVADGTDRVGALAATGNPGTSVQQVLEVLTAQGLGATGPFALLFWVDGDLSSQGLGVIVRGDARVTVDTPDGPVSVSSRGVTTWTEQIIEGPTGFSVEVDASAATGAPALPLVAGAAWVSRIRLADDVGSSAAAGQTTSPASVATPAATGAAAKPTPEPVAPAASDQQSPGRLHEETRVFHTATRSGADQAETESSADPASPDAAEPEGYDYLFGATVFRPVGAAAGLSRDPQADATAADGESSMPVPAFLDASRQGTQPAVREETVGDHDGRTVLASDISAARDKARRTPPAAQAPARPAGHHYLLELPDGGQQPLTAPVILGRAPSVSNVPASVLPHLVTLAGDDISRSHVRVGVEGDTVVVTDLHSSNGTHVIAPGKLPQLLRAGEPTPVITGTVIDLGSGIVLRVSEA